MISRRDLIKTGGALIVSFTLRNHAVAQNAAGAKPVDPKEVDSFLAVHADGSVTVYTGKVDLGTGLRIAIRQMAAEELGLPVEKVALVEGDTGLTPDQGSTGGSTGLTRGGVEVRQAAATAREALAKMDPGQLASGQRFFLKVDPKAQLKDPKQYLVVGKPLPRPDVPAKCTGKHTYIQDFVLPGLLHGRVIRPPAVGAKLVSVDETSIKGIPDVRIVRQGNFLGVVAKDEWAAIRGSRELKATWSDWEGLPGNAGLQRFVREGAVDRDDTIVNKGSFDAGLSSAAQSLSATYFWPNQSHGSIGPSCAVADAREGGVTVWSASQGPHGLRQNLAKIFRMLDEKVHIVYLDGAGCYGGNGNEDVAADAVLMSQSVGAPVRVQWMRHDEHGWDPKGPQQVLELRAGLDREGRITAWENQMWVPTTKPGSRPLLAADLAGIPQDHGQGSGLLTQNGDAPYNVPNVRVVAHLTKETPLRPSNLRAPGKIANVFAVEAFTDELASAAKIDPLAFRLRSLSDPRAVAVLNRAASMFGWNERPSPNRAAGQGNVKSGRGIAYARYKQAENYVALAMQVTVDTNTGKISVQRICCAHDCGLVVNPDALKNQIEGCILQTLSRALHEEVRFDRSRVTSLDWNSYPILTFPEVPTVEVALIDHPELPLLGAGEASCVTVAAALANAVFDATGAKLRVAPFIQERVKAALV
jgi:CO/xanthine dehydrogenase Mo-binding subunit